MSLTTPSPAARWLPVVLLLVGIAVALSIMSIFKNASDDPVNDGSASQPPANQEEVDTRIPVSFSGDGEGNSTSAVLSGDYSVAWQTLGDCFYSADLESDNESESVFSADVAMSGTANLFSVPEGDYHLEVITGPAPGCGWSATFTPN